MSRTFIFLTLLIVSSFCIERKADNFNQIIDELVELNSAIATPADKVARTIASIRAAANDSATAFSAFYTQVQANCASGRKQLANFASKLQGDLVNAQAGINSATKAAALNKKNAGRFQAQAAAARSALAKTHARQQKEAATYREQLLEAEAKMVVIKHVRNIVVDELLNGKAPASLLQVNTISSKLNQLKSMVEASNDSMFTTVVNSLIEMASEKNLSSQRILRKFLGALKKLNDKLKLWISTSAAENKKMNAINKANNAAKLKSVRALGRLLVEARSSVVAAARTIRELKNATTVLGRSIHRKSQEAHHWGRICAAQAKTMTVFRDARASLKAKVTQVSAALLHLK
jgi:hypothetical protein